MTLYEAVDLVRPADREAMRRTQQRWSQVAKPLDSLGVLETDLVRIAGAQRTPDISLEEKWIAVMCADNGIVAEGVTQTGQEVTAAVAERMGRRASCVCLMAARAGARIFPVDVGIASRERIEGLLERKVRRGTEDFLKGPAMSRAEAIRAAECGVETAGILADQGCRLAGAGEMGIGNTTTSSALISVFLGITPREAAGRGAGLSDAGYRRKVQVIEEGIRKNRPDPSDPLDVLAKVGGLDLAALAGFYIGCAARGIPVVLDGLITGAAALAAVRLCPAAGADRRRGIIGTPGRKIFRPGLTFPAGVLYSRRKQGKPHQDFIRRLFHGSDGFPAAERADQQGVLLRLPVPGHCELL